MKLLTRLKAASQKGFTLIELLVVIGILGILAAALVATIDPFEQLNKAQDTNIKNTAVEYINGNIRWYTTHNAFPWDPAANGGVDCNGSAAPNVTQLSSPGMATGPTICIAALVSDKEVKPGFVTATTQLQAIYVTYTAATNELAACFMPKSTSQQKDANVQYNRNGTVNAAKNCANKADPNNGCYWCGK